MPNDWEQDGGETDTDGANSIQNKYDQLRFRSLKWFLAGSLGTVVMAAGGVEYNITHHQSPAERLIYYAGMFVTSSSFGRALQSRVEINQFRREHKNELTPLARWVEVPDERDIPLEFIERTEQNKPIERPKED